MYLHFLRPNLKFSGLSSNETFYIMDSAEKVMELFALYEILIPGREKAGGQIAP